MPLADRVAGSLASLGLGDARLLVAASGGVDSTVLLRTLASLGRDVVAAHVDHGLRPESADDGAFVAALGAELGVPVVRLAVSVGEGNVQAQARRARYAALAEAARQHACAAVVTGHTATDQAETVLLALARGAGLRGLGGMEPSRALGEVRLIRPLLQTTKKEVEAEARARGWTWREDASNATGRYRRNRIRHDVLPALRAEGGDDLRLAAAAASARAALALVRARLADVLDGDQLALDLAREPAEVRHLLLAEAVAQRVPDAVRSRALVGRLDALLSAEVGARVEGGGLVAWRERDAVRLGPLESAPPALGWLSVEPLAEVPVTFPTSPLVEVVDADRAGSPVVRRWRDGDRIRPLGLGGSQLVSDVLQSRGVPLAERAGVAVVEVGGEVAWVVGHRLAAAVAVTGRTRRAARWTWRDEG